MKRTTISAVMAAHALAGITATTSLTSANPAAAATSPSERTVVNAWYSDFLGRDAATDPGSQYWVDQITRAKPADALWSITHSREYTASEVQGLYRGYLPSRPVPQAEAAQWSEGVLAGRYPLEWVLQNLLAGKAYAEQAKTRNPSASGGRALPQQWYTDVLGRDASGGEADYWAGRITRVGALGALRELYYSPEAVGHRIDQHYHELLGRGADPAGLGYWYAKEVESDINVQVLLASTPEYRTRSTDPTYSR